MPKQDLITITQSLLKKLAKDLFVKGYPGII
jgi:hypothetical protein